MPLPGRLRGPNSHAGAENDYDLNVLPTLLERCGLKFTKFRQCHDRITRETLTTHPDMLSIKQALQTTATNSSLPDSSTPSRESLLSRGNHLLARQVFESCSYIQTPLKECVAEVACARERGLRDELFGSGGEIGEDERHRLMELEQDFQRCLRVFQMRMDWAMRKGEPRLAGGQLKDSANVS